MSGADAAVLTDAYRRTQARLAAESASSVTVAFHTLLDPADLDATFPRYVLSASRLIDAKRAQVAAAASAYYTAHRAELGITSAAEIAYAATAPPAQVTTALLVTGPVTAKRALANGATVAEALGSALSATLGAAYRLTANGGRDTLHRTIDRDRLAIGWQRVPDGRPCAFCAMLAGRGPVYRTQAAAFGARRYHDKCGCHPEAVYRRDQAWAPGSRDLAQMWADAPGSTLADFRAYYNALAPKP